MDSVTENVIEWIRGQQTATLTLTRGPLVTRVKKLAEQRPEECQIIAQNEDGSILAHVPVKWSRINPTLTLSEEEKERRKEIALNMVEKRKQKHQKTFDSK